MIEYNPVHVFVFKFNQLKLSINNMICVCVFVWRRFFIDDIARERKPRLITVEILSSCD